MIMTRATVGNMICFRVSEGIDLRCLASAGQTCKTIDHPPLYQVPYDVSH